MVILRVVRGVTDHFPGRVSDWFLASILTNVGFDSHGFWSVLCLSIGLTRLIALTINGTFPKLRWSPHVRFVMAILSGCVWVQLALGADPMLYRYLLLFDIYNTHLAAAEAGRGEHERNKLHALGTSPLGPTIG